MRRRVLVIAIGISLLMSFARIGLALTQTAADDFSSGGYTGSTGTVAWASTWAEIGEADGAGSGAVRVENSPSLCSSGSCLTLKPELLGLGQVGASRSVDTTGATAASLSYHLDFPSGLLVSMRVEARADGGSPGELRTHTVGTEGVFTVNLPAAETLELRFVLEGLSILTLGAQAGIDDVVVTIIAPDPTTTTTTSTTAPPTGPTTTQPSPTTTPGPTATPRPVDRPTDETPGPTTTSQPEDSTTSTATDEDQGELVPAAIDDEALPPSQTFGVVTNVNPGLGPTSNGLLKPRTGFLVDFSTEVEDVTIDLLASALLGLLLAVVSDRRLGAKIDG